MSTASEKKKLTNHEVIKIIIGVVTLVGAWYRMEYKFDQVSAGILKKIDEHIISANYERQRQDKEIAELKSQVERMQNESKEFFKNEFIRPDETKIKNRRRSYNEN